MLPARVYGMYASGFTSVTWDKLNKAISIVLIVLYMLFNQLQFFFLLFLLLSFSVAFMSGNESGAKQST